MSSIEPLNPGSELAGYRLRERIGPFVWRCDETKSGKSVAAKVLTRQLPKEPARREDVFKHVRLGAALYHPFLIPIIDVVAAGDTLLLVMELIDAKSLTSLLGGKPRSTEEIFRTVYQLADVLKFLHARETVHSNVNGDSVLIGADGHVHLAGLNLNNLLPRKEGSSSPSYQQKANDTRSVSYMSAEQIAGQPIDFRTDIYSFGIVMYELATGSLPWPRGPAASIAQAIVEGKPQSPRSINPAVDGKVIEAIAHCVAKERTQRHKDGKAAAEEIARISPSAAAFAGEIAGRANAVARGALKKEVRASVLLIADVDAIDPDAPTSATAKMQQIVGEAAYLFDGKVVDPFGPRLVAEMPSVEAAIEAARKAEFDLIAQEEAGESLPVRLLLHAGEVTVEGGAATGDAVTRGFSALAGAPHRELFISEEFVKMGRAGLRLRDAGARGGVKLFEIAPADRLPAGNGSVSTPTPTSLSTVEITGPPLPDPKRRRFLIAAVVGLLVIGGGVAGLMFSRHTAPPPAPVVVPKPQPTIREFSIAPFTADGTDPSLTDRASAIRLAVLEILRQTHNVKIVDDPAAGGLTYGAAIRSAGSAPTLVPLKGSADAGPAVPLGDNASAVAMLVDWIAKDARVHPRVTQAPAALNAFTDAVAARAAKDSAKLDSALHASIAADPTYLPALSMAMDVFSAEGNDKDAFESARQVLAFAPDNADAARIVARGSLARGDVPLALAAYGQVLHSDRGDLEALNTIGYYAFSASDAARFNAAIARLKEVKAAEPRIHEPDLLTAAGRFDDAVQKYYDIEVDQPNNPVLALKIGRIAVLRHTPDIAKLELKKLQQSDPAYGAHLLAAYIAAGEGARAEASRELVEALKASKPGDTYWTCAAEVYAITGEAKKVISSLQTAADRREPTISYILTDPLFTFLASDPKFLELRNRFLAEKTEIRTALAKITI